MKRKAPVPSSISAASSGPAGPDPLALLHALLRRWRLAVVLSLLSGVVVAAAAWNYQTPAPYQARALLHVAAAPPQVVFATGEPRADFATYRQTQLALLKSRLVLGSALKDPQVAGLPLVTAQADPVAWLEKDLRVDAVPGPEILRLTLKGNDADDLATLVNGVVRAYLREIVNKEQDNRSRRLAQLQDLHRQYDASLAAKRAELSQLARAAGSHDARVLAFKQELALKRLYASQQELLQRQLQITRLEVELKDLQAHEKAVDQVPVLEAEIELALKQDPVIAGRLTEIHDLEVALENVRQVAKRGPSDPSYTRYSDALLRAREALEARRQQQIPVVVEDLRCKARVNLRKSIVQAQDQLAMLKEHERVLGEQVERLGQEPRALNESSMGLENLRTEITEVEAISRRISGEIEALKVEVHAPARVTILEEAVVTPTQEERRRSLMTLMVGFGTVGLTLTGVAWGECRRGKVTSAREAAEKLGLRLVGTVPLLSEGRQRNLVLPTDRPASYRANSWIEALDATRAVLLHGLKRAGRQVVMIGSAAEGEGKSTLAVGLAASLARAGFRTLLVDGDLRRPSLHQRFLLPPTPGLCEVLRDTATLAEAVRPTTQEGLAVLTAGRLDERALQALSQAEGGALFQELKGQFDFVLVDSSPLLAVADPLLLARQADGVLLTALRNASQLPKTQAARERLTEIGIPLLGIVVQGVRGQNYGRYYAYRND